MLDFRLELLVTFIAAGRLAMKNKRAVVSALGLVALVTVIWSVSSPADAQVSPFTVLVKRFTRHHGFAMHADAMVPTIEPNDRIVAAALPYREADPRPGDIIVFTYASNMSKAFVSRVIAVGETTIEIRDGRTMVGGVAVQEDYVPDGARKSENSRTMAKIRVPPGQLFVMGDNRDHSDDSRAKGFVPRDFVIGKISKISGPTHPPRQPKVP